MYAWHTASSALSAATPTLQVPTPSPSKKCTSAPRKAFAKERPNFISWADCIPIYHSIIFLELIRGLKQRHPHVHLKAFTMVEVHYFARIAKLTVDETLRKMKEAGVDSCPGGGAEIFHPRVRRLICDHKVSGQMWVNIAKKAHRIGLRSNATMLYGHVETMEERVDHLVKLREAAGRNPRLRRLHPPGVSPG